MRISRLWPVGLSLLALLLTSCSAKTPDVPKVARCEVDLSASRLFRLDGEGARAKIIAEEADLIGGQMPTGRLGDTLLANDRIRVIVQKPGRHLGPVLFGGNLVDADLVRGPGEAGQDQFGKLGLVHSFGRTVNAKGLEILADGSRGGPAIVAATGRDALLDHAFIQTTFDQLGAGVQPVVDPEDPQPLLITTYYVLSPGEDRVRILTALCNDGDAPILTAVGDIVEQGGSTTFFNPGSCANDVGANDCLVDPAPWFGFQGNRVAYGYRAYTLEDLSRPDHANALWGTKRVLTVAGGESTQAMLAWVDPEAQNRPGTMVIREDGQKTFLRDFWVTRSLGELTTEMTRQDTEAQGRGLLRVRVTAADGDSPAAGVRVAVDRAGSGKLVTFLQTNDLGRAEVELPVGAYQLRATAIDHPLSPVASVEVGASSEQDVFLSMGVTRRLTVSVRDPFGAPIPAKVTVLCADPGGCATPPSAWRHLYDLEVLPTNLATIGLVPPEGRIDLVVPPGKYTVVVTRGPEYSVWPDTWPQQGEPIDLQERDVELDATLAKVVDSEGWMSADLHVHAVNSPDSSVANELRVLGYLAEGVDILASTDHEVTTDFAPYVEALHAGAWLTTLVGQEVSPPFGHQNLYPLPRIPGALPVGDGFDWAGADDLPTLRPPEIWKAVRALYPDALIQLNHPRGNAGAIHVLQVDTATGATALSPETYRMAPDAAATATDTKLFGTEFDALEVANGMNLTYDTLNDWMTFLSRGLVKTGVATSDTHTAFQQPGGYGRTFVNMAGADSAAQFTAPAFVAAMRSQKAIATNGPFLKVTAQRLDATGNPLPGTAGVGETISLNAAAGEKLELTVDVQAPSWMGYDTIDVYTHAPGREAASGTANTTWPSQRILQTRAVNPHLRLEPLPGVPGTFQRSHVVESFAVTPAADTWFVVLVRSTPAMPTLFPLAFRGVRCANGECRPNAARPFAFSNAILVDADGSGAYDNFPISGSGTVGQGLRARAPEPLRPARRTPTSQELETFLQSLQHEH